VDLISSFPTGNVWSTGETDAFITVSTSQPAVTVTHTDGNGCQATSNPVAVVVSPFITPVITASGPLEFCQGGQVTLTSNIATGNIWSNGETTQSIQVTTSGTFTLTLQGCSNVSLPVVVTVNPQPLVPTITVNGPTTFCQGGQVNLVASASTLSYLWSDG
jgi:hypothetical protein